MQLLVKAINVSELRNELWSGALETLEIIIQEEKLQDLMNLLEEMYPEPVDITTINDWFWFEEIFLFEQLGIGELVQKRLSWRNLHLAFHHDPLYLNQALPSTISSMIWHWPNTISVSKPYVGAAQLAKLSSLDLQKKLTTN